MPRTRESITDGKYSYAAGCALRGTALVEDGCGTVAG
jgi:hypothetical protein